MKRSGTNVKRLDRSSWTPVELPLIVALTIGPSLMVPFADSGFEPPKAVLLWVMAFAAVTITIMSGSRDVWRLTSTQPWTRAVSVAAACAAVPLLVSVSLSDAPLLGWCGSALRRFGGGTELALLGVLTVAASVSTKRHVRGRMLIAAAVGGIGPTVYALSQWAGVDPFSAEPTRWVRPGSTFGNPLLLGGYLIAVFPLTIAGAIIAERPLVKRALWALVVLQCAALAVARAAGPILALVAAWAIAGTAFLAAHRRRVVVVALTVALALAAVAAFIAGPRVVRSSTTTIGVRALLWQAAGAGIETERRRLVLGSGPEAITRVLTRYSYASLRKIEGPNIAPDRTHNQTLDTIVAFGVVGFGARLALVYLGLAAACSVFGLLPRSEYVRFVALAIGVTAIVSGAGWVRDGAWTLAFSVPAALVMAAASWIGWRSRFAVAPDPRDVVPVAAATTSVLAHYFETQTGIATVSSALVAAVALALTAGAAAGPIEASAVRRPGWLVLFGSAAALAAVLLYAVVALFEATDDRRLVQQAQAIVAAADAADSTRRGPLMQAAARQLERAWSVNPYDYHHARNRASLERRWAGMLPAAERAPHLAEAEWWYAAAVDLAPSAPLVWEEWANLALESRLPFDALPRLDRSAALGLETSELLVLGDAALGAIGVDIAGPSGTARAIEVLRSRGYAHLADRYDRRRP